MHTPLTPTRLFFVSRLFIDVWFALFKQTYTDLLFRLDIILFSYFLSLNTNERQIDCALNINFVLVSLSYQTDFVLI
jgi:hypothetical protein